tara:strand:+ start:101 stop:463 length:363 start_codon:yes stop_codon:yes gene_type:complete
MAIDYNDPVVAEEFNNVQPMTYEEVEEELSMSGVRGSADMNEMDLKLMLVELRLVLSGKHESQFYQHELEVHLIHIGRTTNSTHTQLLFYFLVCHRLDIVEFFSDNRVVVVDCHGECSGR